MLKLTCMRGISGSGKSTQAAKIARATGAVIVNRDQLRKMMLNDWWTGDKTDEDRVTVAEEAQVEALLNAGTSVIADATHLHPPFLRKWARVASRLGVEFEVVDIHADPDECKRRIYQRWCAEVGTDSPRYLDPKIVDQQIKRYPVEKWPTIKADPPFVVEPVGYDGLLASAYIFDIDGTLAINSGGRSPYDYTRVNEDTLDRTVADIYQVLRGSDLYPRMIIMSGRDDTCRVATVQWLTNNAIFFDALYMRDTKGDVNSSGDKLPDVQVKSRLFDEHVRNKYCVRAVFDDRDQVVDLWRRLGLKCLQVAEGNF